MATRKIPKKLIKPFWAGLIERESLANEFDTARLLLGAIFLGYSWFAGIVRITGAYVFLFDSPAKAITYLLAVLFQFIITLGQWFTSSKNSRWYLFWLFPDALTTAYDFSERLDYGLIKIATIAGANPFYGTLAAGIIGAIVGLIAARYGEKNILDSKKSWAVSATTQA